MFLRIKSPVWLVLIFISSATFCLPQERKAFREEQWKYPRVRTAAKEKDEILKQMFEAKKLVYPPRNVFFQAFKKEGILELWASDSEEKPFLLVKEYRICTSSGVLGPKRRFGDEQVPEGFYELDWFNPQSNFFLSMHISYPNATDRILGSHQNPGGDIFLHGDCASIGCIPITDDGIKEVYWLSVLAHNRGQQQLPMQIFPARLSEEGFKGLESSHPKQPGLIAFWANLREGYDLFEKTHLPPRVKTRKDGSYEFSSTGHSADNR